MVAPVLKDEPAQKGYETPTYDRLKPQWKSFVHAYLKSNNAKDAALEAGYLPKYATERGFILARRPVIVKALEELCARELRASEHQRSQIITRLMAESMVSLEDLTEWDAESELTVPRSSDNVAEYYRSCMGLLTVSREGHCVLNMSAQNTARKLLSSYMKWDRELAETNAPISFDFGALKPNIDVHVSAKPKK